jgi:hypothetical protein
VLGLLAVAPATAITLALAALGIAYVGEIPWIHYLDVFLFYVLSLWYCTWAVCLRMSEGVLPSKSSKYPRLEIAALVVLSTIPLVNIGLELWWAFGKYRSRSEAQAQA